MDDASGHPMNDPYIEDEINLRDCWRVLVRRRRLILGIIGVAAVTTAIFTLLQPNIYQSKVTLMPLGKGAGSLPGALGGLRSLLPLGALSRETPAERLLAILHSRTLAEEVIRQLDLLPRLFAEGWDAERQQWQTDKPPTLQDAVRALEELVSITSDKKTGVITIAAEHTDPDLAATIANQYIAALQRILNDKAFSLAKKNRLFIEAQLQRTRRDLAAAEEALRRFEQAHKIIALDAQAEAAVDAIARLEGKIMAKEVQLRVLQRTVTGASREVTLLQEELRGLRAQLARLQHGTPASSTTYAFPTVEDAPEVRLQYERLRREAVIQGELFTLLTQQLEQARIEEARDETAFQVLDRAIPPDRKSKPRRVLSVVLATMVGTFLGVFAAFFREYLDSTVRTREQVEGQLDLSLLAVVPPAVPQGRRRRRQSASDVEADLVLNQPPGTPLVEAHRYLHTHLKHLNGGRGIQTMVLTSPEPDAAVPIALVNLAIIAAGMGEKTLLVDSNLRQPGLYRLLGCPPAPGLADILADPEGWHKGVQATTVDHLYLVPAGAVTPAACTSLGSPAFDALLTRFKETYSLVLFAAPPVLGCTDAVVLGSKVEATCLVLTAGVTRIEAVTEARTALEAVRANVIGAVFLDQPGQ
jgi:capsular exopolysaccharide synthesis family protein